MDRNELRVWQNAREQAAHERLERVLQIIVEKAAAVTDADPLFEMLEQIEETRLIALHCHPPQVMAAVAALRLRADVLGLIVRKQAIATGKPGEFASATDEEAVYERLRERFGTEKTEYFKTMVERFKGILNGEVIEGEAQEIAE